MSLFGQRTVIDIVKAGGTRPSEEFNADKLHSSIVAACLAVRTPEGQAEAIARDVCTATMAWCSTKPEVTNSDLRRIASRTLQTHHPDAAYLYKHHKLIV